MDKQKIKEFMNVKYKITSDYFLHFIKWIIIAVTAGIIGGAVGGGFSVTLSKVTQLRQQYAFIIYFLPISGLIIVWLYKMSDMADYGINSIINSIRGTQRIPYRLLPLIFTATAITHLFGGSAGREGAALQLGGSIGYNLGNIFRLDKNDLHIAVQSGMAAVFAALFGTPITAAIFALEVISVGIIHYSAVLPCIVSAVIAAKTSAMLGIAPEKFPLEIIYPVNLKNLGITVATAGICALVSILFCFCMHSSAYLFKKYIKNPYIRIVCGGVIVVLLTIILQTHDYNGAGMNIIEKALKGEALPYAFLLKILFTAVTIGCGFKGGEIVPTFFIGATLGTVIGGLFGDSTGFYGAIGLVAAFCGVVNCPIASIFLSIELFGSDSLPLFATASAVSYILSGYYGLYPSQKIVYSKLKSKYINVNTK